MLRCLGLSAEPADQASFFNTALTDAIHSGARRILICGSSDTAMPDLVLAIAEAVSVPVQLHLLDICPTPGQLALRHLKPKPSSLQVVASDILRWVPSQLFDVIITHSLLGQFSQDARSGLFAKWHQMLQSGGRVITINRLRNESGIRTYSETMAKAVADEAVSRYVVGNFGSNITPDDLHVAVLDYCRNRASHPVQSAQSIADLCKAAGLEILLLESQKAGSLSTGLSGPAMPDGATYCHLIAQRPD